MAVLLAHLKVPLTWTDIFKRTFREAFWKDNCLGLAAQLAYYFFFALFPALLFLLALASYFPVDTLIDDMFRALGGFVPPEVLSIITDQIKKISEGEQTGLLTFGMLATLWSSSAAMTAIIDTLNSAYDVEEGRAWWKVRLVAIGLTIGVALFILVSFALVLLGPRLAEIIADRTVLGPAFEWTWKILQWPLVFALASTGIAMIYYFAPDVEQDWIWLTPGSVFATTIWLIASLGFKYYVTNMGAYVETYGAIGGVMVLMLWFYISGLAILIGAEMNAEIEHASPYGKDEGEKVPGQKRKIGAARMQEWIAKRRQRGEKPPSSEEVKEAVGPPPPDKEPGAPIPPVPRGVARPAEQAPPPAARPLTPTPVTAFATVKKTAFDVLIGAGIVVAAEAWLAVKMLRKLRSKAA
jgi:membrane protein